MQAGGLQEEQRRFKDKLKEDMEFGGVRWEDGVSQFERSEWNS